MKLYIAASIPRIRGGKTHDVVNAQPKIMSFPGRDEKVGNDVHAVLIYQEKQGNVAFAIRKVSAAAAEIVDRIYGGQRHEAVKKTALDTTVFSSNDNSPDSIMARPS